MSTRAQYFPAVNFAMMKDGEDLTVPFTGEPHYVKVSADGRVEYQRSQDREVTYQVDEAAKTITFLMLKNGRYGRQTKTKAASHPQMIGGGEKGTVTSIQGRKKQVPEVQAIPNQKLGMRERMLRSFWREAYVASLSGGGNAVEALKFAENGLLDYEKMMATRDAAILKESARG